MSDAQHQTKLRQAGSPPSVVFAVDDAAVTVIGGGLAGSAKKKLKQVGHVTLQSFEGEKWESLYFDLVDDLDLAVIELRRHDEERASAMLGEPVE